MSSQKHQTNALPIAVSIPAAAHLTSLSESKIDEAIRIGALVTRRYGNRTLIRVADLTAWVDAMPVGRPASPPQFAGRRTGRPRKNTDAEAGNG